MTAWKRLICNRRKGMNMIRENSKEEKLKEIGKKKKKKGNKEVS
jgi:hypothetical protein